MKPCDCVLVLDERSPYAASAGVVEKVELDDKGQLKAVIVDLDRDHRRVRFAPSELRVIKAH